MATSRRPLVMITGRPKLLPAGDSIIAAGGSDTEVQYNDAGVIAGAPGALFDKTGNTFIVKAKVGQTADIMRPCRRGSRVLTLP